MSNLFEIETGCQLVTRAPLPFCKTETTVASFHVDRDVHFKDSTIKYIFQNGSNHLRAVFEQKTRGFIETDNLRSPKMSNKLMIMIIIIIIITIIIKTIITIYTYIYIIQFRLLSCSFLMVFFALNS